MVKQKYSFLLKNIILFAISSFIPKALSFILIPIYTGYLSTEEYGIADLISVTVELAVPIFTLTIYDAILRFILDTKNDSKEVVSIGISITFIGGVIVCGFALFVAVLLKSIDFTYILFFILMYVVSSFNTVFSVVLRGLNKTSVIAISGIVNSIVSLSANILFLTVFNWGLTGYLIANIIGGAISIIIELFCGKIYKYITFHINKKVKREMIKFSFPMIFSALAWWVNNASDRYILTLLVGVNVSGLYAVACKIPNIISTFQNVFSKAWSVSAIKEFDPNDSDGFVGNMYTLFIFCVVLASMILIALNIVMAKILYSNEFFTAWEFVPPLVVASAFNAFSVFTGSLFMSVKDTKNRSISTIIGAVSNTSLNFILIPFYGAYGAAIATCIGFMLSYIYQEIKIRKHISIKTNRFRNYIAVLLVVVQMVLAFWGNRFIIIQICLIGIVLLLYFDMIVYGVKKFKHKFRKEQC